MKVLTLILLAVLVMVTQAEIFSKKTINLATDCLRGTHLDDKNC